MHRSTSVSCSSCISHASPVPRSRRASWDLGVTTVFIWGLFGVADDRPVTIVAVDYEEVLRTAVEQSRDMLDSALTLMLDVELM